MNRSLDEGETTRGGGGGGGELSRLGRKGNPGAAGETKFSHVNSLARLPECHGKNSLITYMSFFSFFFFKSLYQSCQFVDHKC